ncbi:MAG: flavin reductase [Sphingopyxis sp.]|nr:flavin reductase [Sphingopyxis sp.]
MIDPEQFRTAMWRLGAAVNIITTDGRAGCHGMTASAVCRVSDDPGALLVCVNRSSRMNAILVENGKLCINVLAAGQQALSGRFARRGLTADELRLGESNDGLVHFGRSYHRLPMQAEL